MKHRISFLLLLLSLFACEPKSNKDMPKLMIGKQDFKQIDINTETLRRIVLLGGNGKYTASIANPNIASLKIVQDTLKIMGLYEGQTYATIHSHNFSKRLNIAVVPPRLSFSHNEIRLRPADYSQFVTLNGGGKDVHIELDDPQDCLQYKWNANTNIIELFPRYEGEAIIRAKSEKGEEQSLKVYVQSSDRIETQDIGFYSTRSGSVYPIFGTPLFAFVKGKGLWLFSSAQADMSSKNRVFIEALPSLKKGTYADVKLHFYLFKDKLSNELKTDTYKLFVEEIDAEKVYLRGKGFRFVLPSYFIE